MNLDLCFQKKWKRSIFKKVIHAIQRYEMFERNDTITVALSGGKDSISLLVILWFLSHYSHLEFHLLALHIKTDDYETNLLQDICNALEIEYFEKKLNRQPIVHHRSICYACSRLKRGAISRFLQGKNLSKTAFGHHAEDVAETFFMNMIQHKKLGSFSPKVCYSNNPMVVIRPLIYLSEKDIKRFHQAIELPTLAYQCPFIQANIRFHYRQFIRNIGTEFQLNQFSQKLVESLENIDETNLWRPNDSKSKN